MKVKSHGVLIPVSHLHLYWSVFLIPLRAIVLAIAGLPFGAPTAVSGRAAEVNGGAASQPLGLVKLDMDEIIGD